jgi:hypothetical protein
MIDIEVNGYRAVGYGFLQGHWRLWCAGPGAIQVPSTPLGTEPDGIGYGADRNLRGPLFSTMMKLHQAGQSVSPTRLVREMAKWRGQCEVQLSGRMHPDGGVAPARICFAVGLKEPPGRLPALPPFGLTQRRSLQVVAGIQQAMSTTNDPQVPRQEFAVKSVEPDPQDL